MHRFFIDAVARAGEKAVLSKNEAQHAIRVLRLKSGEGVEALDKSGGAWSGELLIEGEEAYILLNEKLPSNEAPIELTLYMGLPKGEKLELIAQKITEIGAKRLVPVRMERSIAKILPSEADKKLSRPRRISLEAQKQSGRQSEMEILDPIDFNEMLARIKTHDAAFMLWENARGFRLSDARERLGNLKDIACVVGPEGGISQIEAARLVEAGSLSVTLGPRILRAETAAIVSCAEIMCLWGDM